MSTWYDRSERESDIIYEAERRRDLIIWKAEILRGDEAYCFSLLAETEGKIWFITINHKAQRDLGLRRFVVMPGSRAAGRGHKIDGALSQHHSR